MINLYNKDCMEAMKDMADNQYDLAIVDPPYGLERFKASDGGNSKKIKCDWYFFICKRRIL